jgi:hypothetical protein
MAEIDDTAFETEFSLDIPSSPFTNPVAFKLGAVPALVISRAKSELDQDSQVPGKGSCKRSSSEPTKPSIPPRIFQRSTGTSCESLVLPLAADSKDFEGLPACQDDCINFLAQPKIFPHISDPEVARLRRHRFHTGLVNSIEAQRQVGADVTRNVWVTAASEVAALIFAERMAPAGQP